MTRRLVARVDATACTGAQMCRSIAPDSYRYDDEAFTSPVRWRALGRCGDPRGAEDCPLDAITVRDTHTGEQVFL